MRSSGLDRIQHRPAHLVYAALSAGSAPLFLGAFLSDAAYANSYEIAWKNQAAWFLVGALIVAGVAIAAGIVWRLRQGRFARTEGWSLGLLIAAWVAGFVGSLVHAKDGWAMMPDGLVVSALATLLVLAAAVLAFTALRAGGGR